MEIIRNNFETIRKYKFEIKFYNFVNKIFACMFDDKYTFNEIIEAANLATRLYKKQKLELKKVICFSCLCNFVTICNLDQLKVICPNCNMENIT